MQAVLEVDLAVPLHGVREQVAVEGRVLGEQRVQRQLALGRDQLVQADLPGRDHRPVPGGEAVVGVRPPVPYRLEDQGPGPPAPRPVAGAVDRFHPSAAGPARADGPARGIDPPARRLLSEPEDDARGRRMLALGPVSARSAARRVDRYGGVSRGARRPPPAGAAGHRPGLRLHQRAGRQQGPGRPARPRRRPATIRNDMAVLEEEGYITQPHTSAGRVPTDKGYRFFVDRLQLGQAAVGGRAPGHREVPRRRRRPARRAAAARCGCWPS